MAGSSLGVIMTHALQKFKSVLDESCMDLERGLERGMSMATKFSSSTCALRTTKIPSA
jgi:hypothetical protein